MQVSNTSAIGKDRRHYISKLKLALGTEYQSRGEGVSRIPNSLLNEPWHVISNNVVF